MNNSLLINATLDQPGLLENLVEKLAQRHADTGEQIAEEQPRRIFSHRRQ